MILFRFKQSRRLVIGSLVVVAVLAAFITAQIVHRSPGFAQVVPLPSAENACANYPQQVAGPVALQNLTTKDYSLNVGYINISRMSESVPVWCVSVNAGATSRSVEKFMEARVGWYNPRKGTYTWPNDKSHIDNGEHLFTYASITTSVPPNMCLAVEGTVNFQEQDRTRVFHVDATCPKSTRMN